ncbi:ribosomal protein S5 domain 2-like protein [Pisolithus marmoratus]|nr:ribosomal protein S5 domain 2-like protein [Pisolithus marmoratus]
MTIIAYESCTMTALSKVEISYIKTSLLSDPPLRADGRSPEDFRPIVVETGVAPLANGSARVSIGVPRGGRGHEAEGAGGRTEVVAAVKLEVDGVGEDEEGGKIICNVSCSPAAYPHLSSPALDDLQSDLTSLMGSVLSHPSLCPKNLAIVPGQKAWALRLDTIVFADAGNVVDCLMMACRAALVDTRVPSTRSVEYRAPGTQSGTLNKVSDDIMDVDQGRSGSSSMLETRKSSSVVDFELADYWDEGGVLESRDAWPVCVTLNMLPTMHFLDATSQEETAVPLRLHAMFAFPGGKPTLHGMRMTGTGTSDITQIKVLLKHAEKYARNMWTGLDAKLGEEEARRSVKARAKFYGRRGR